MYSVYVAVIICWCHQKWVMSDTVITVIAPEKAIHNTEDLVRHETTTAHVSSSGGSFLFDCLKMGQFQCDFCMKNMEAVYWLYGWPEWLCALIQRANTDWIPDSQCSAEGRMFKTIILINESVLPYCRKCGPSISARRCLNHSPQ